MRAYSDDEYLVLESVGAYSGRINIQRPRSYLRYRRFFVTLGSVMLATGILQLSAGNGWSGLSDLIVAACSFCTAMYMHKLRDLALFMEACTDILRKRGDDDSE